MSDFRFDKECFKAAINRTGFPTEHSVQRVLESHGWEVVSNRYYIDDERKVEREIDLVATKGMVRLVVSCKKSDEELWGFVTDSGRHEDAPLEF